MVDVDKLSDEELRTKLQEFGYPVMPVTGTTRPTMIKKLKILLENQNQINKGNRRSLGRYSSEEESDSDSRATRRNKNKRATMAAPMTAPSVKKKPITKTDSFSEPPAKKEVKTSTMTTRTMKIVQSAKDEFDTGSESDEVAEKYSSISSYKKDSPTKSLSLNEGFKKTPSPTRLPSCFLSGSSIADATSDKINQIRSRNSQSYTSSFDRSYYSSTNTDDLLRDRESTPFLSNFTKNLSQTTERPRSTTYDYKSDIIKENDINGGAASARTYLNSYRTTRGRPTTYDYKQTNQSIFKKNWVPITVLAVAFLFFFSVAVVYLGIRSDTALEATAKVPICVKSDPNSRRYVNCVLEGEGKAALRLLQVLKPELIKRGLENKCTDNTLKPYMTEHDITAFITRNFAVKNETKILLDLSNVEVLSFLNPSWGIAVHQVDKDGAEFTSDTVAKNMDQVNEGKRTKVTGLIALHLPIPWTCYFYNTIWTFFSILTSLLGGAVILYTCNALFRYYNQYKQKQQEEEVAIVEQIIDILQTNASENDDNYMVINHVRDMILPVNERKSKQKMWNNAVKYVNENESRIRTEVQVVRGEPSEVWRWLGGPNLSTSKNKSWQGQAFETQVGSMNSLPCSPTPCLKIRGMVKEGDRNTHAIKKAVLNKCPGHCRILHCGIDTNSNCVYLKCADPNDAAIAYRNLHGWWYDGNLVTVKYLRLERYMQRFPDSPVSGPPFL